MRRSAKILLVLFPLILVCVAAFFGVVHHFYRYGWAGTLAYYFALACVAAVFIEVLLVSFQE
jgi:Na+/proline symporter